MNKKPVPNLSKETKVSYDFKLAFGNLNNYLERIEENDLPRTRHLAKRAFLHREIPHYDEYFNPDVYQDVVTEENKYAVNEINLVVDEINEKRRQKVSDYEQLAMLRDKLENLING